MSKDRLEKDNSQSKIPLYLSIGILAAVISSYVLIPDVRSFMDKAWEVLTSDDELRIKQWVDSFGWFATCSFDFGNDFSDVSYNHSHHLINGSMHTCLWSNMGKSHRFNCRLPCIISWLSYRKLSWRIHSTETYWGKNRTQGFQFFKRIRILGSCGHTYQSISF